MKNKGALKLLVIMLVVACAYQLSFTLVTRSVEKKAQKHGAQFGPDMAIEKEREYLDSMKAKTVYNLGLIKFTYNECKDKEINLGLDLKGGMNVMLEIAVEDVVVALANDSQDPMFLEAIAQAKKDQKERGNVGFIKLFADAYRDISGGAPLANLFNTPELREYINPTTTDEEVVKVLNREANSAIANSYSVLRNRIDRFGVSQPNIQRIEGTGRILVELPGVKEPERVRKLLQGTASLEFWSTYGNKEIYPMLEDANREVKNYLDLQKTDEPEVVEIQDQVVPMTVVAEQSEDIDELLAAIGEGESGELDDFDQLADYPLFAKLVPIVDPGSDNSPGSPMIGQALTIDTMEVNRYLELTQVKMLFPRDIKFMWGAKPFDENETAIALYAIRANTRDGKAPLDGGVVTDAREEYSDRGATAQVSMIMNAEGAREWAKITGDNIGRGIAIVLDGYVYSAPMVSNEITGGRSSITGQFTINEAKDLANVLKSGKLPAPARIVQDTVVGPSLGAESISKSLIALIVAFIVVMLYMQFFYSTAGFVASLAMILNVFLLVGVLASFGAVLTLPGIAGIILTMGMAVDANVIIYERIKEELRAGRGLSEAVARGYKNAMSAIIDANLTSVITGVILFYFGTGPVQGFATTLIIGILTSMFTSILCTRMMFDSMLKRDRKIKFSTKLTENFLTNTKIDFIKIRKYSYAISLLLIVVSITSFFVRGLNYGVDFTGGRAYVVRFDQSVTADQVRNAVYAEFDKLEDEDRANIGFEVKQFGTANDMRIVTQYKANDESEGASGDVEELLHRALTAPDANLFLGGLTFEEFSTSASNPYGIISADKVGASIASETVRNSFIAVLLALLGIGLYIMFRFKKWQWGAGSVVALAHDALLTIGLFSLFYGVLPFTLEVDQSFIAAVLTIIGYSINDKIIIFDRIREYQNDGVKRSMKDSINAAINSTLTRTVNTSGSTFLTLLAIFLFGGDVIKGFIFALMFGVIIGTFSSIFTATPVAYDLMKNKDELEPAVAAAKKVKK